MKNCELCPDEDTDVCESCGKEAEPMNDIESALVFISEIKEKYAIIGRNSDVYDKKFETIINALEKQIPKKPNNIKSTIFTGSISESFKSGECPCCGNCVESDDDTFYCGHKGCGQAIDWISTEDKG